MTSADGKIVGHGQSGPFFFHKTRFMQNVLGQTVLSCLQESSKYPKPDAVEFFYPSAPLLANPDNSSQEASNLRAWGHGDPEEDQIDGLEDSLRLVSHIMEENGPFVGIVAFSSGAAIAASVAALLERKESAFGFKTKARLPFPKYFMPSTRIKLMPLILNAACALAICDLL